MSLGKARSLIPFSRQQRCLVPLKRTCYDNHRYWESSFDQCVSDWEQSSAPDEATTDTHPETVYVASKNSVMVSYQPLRNQTNKLFSEQRVPKQRMRMNMFRFEPESLLYVRAGWLNLIFSCHPHSFYPVAGQGRSWSTPSFNLMRQISSMHDHGIWSEIVALNTATWKSTKLDWTWPGSLSVISSRNDENQNYTSFTLLNSSASFREQTWRIDDNRRHGQAGLCPNLASVHLSD